MRAPGEACERRARAAGSTRSAIRKLPNVVKARKRPRRKPKSPMRFTMKAFRPAVAFVSSSNQKPMRR